MFSLFYSWRERVPLALRCWVQFDVTAAQSDSSFLLRCHLMLHLSHVSFRRECCRFFGDDGLTPKVVFTKVAPFGLLWILTSYLYLQALRKINTTDASALFCCNKAFVFLLSWIVLRDRFMGVRVSPSARVCVCVCVWERIVYGRVRERRTKGVRVIQY